MNDFASEPQLVALVIDELTEDHRASANDLMAIKEKLRNARKSSIKSAYQDRIDELKEAFAFTAEILKKAKLHRNMKKYDAIIDIGLKTGILDEKELQ